MTRISTYGANQNLITYMMRNQGQLNKYNLQLATNKISQTYGGIATNSQRLVTMETSTTIYQSFIANNSVADIRLNIASTVMEGVTTSTQDFRDTLKDYLAAENSEDNVAYLQDWAYRVMKDLESYLNTAADGRYIFAGSKVDSPPVDFGITDLNSFQSLYDGMFTTYPTTRDAHLADLSLTQDENNLDNGAFIDASNWLTFYQDNDSDQFSSGSGTIEASSSMFSNLSAGSVISVSGTTSGTNDGSYTVSSVSSDTITVTTTMLTDESAIGAFTTETLTDPHGATVTMGDGTAYVTADTGNLTVDGTAATLTAATAGAFASVSIGDHLQLSGSASNDGTYEVTGVAGDVLTLATNTAVTFTLADGTELSRTDTGNVTFDRSADSITVATTGALSGASVGEVITVAGSGQNDGTYTVASNDGTTLTIESLKLTDQGTVSGNTLYDYPAGGQVVFDAAANTITAQDYAGTAISNVFSDYQVGDSITVSDTTVTPTLYTQVEFTSVGVDQDTIQIQDGSAAAVQGAFDGVQIGDTVTLAGATNGANDQAYVVNFVSADGSTITVDGNIGAAATDVASIAVTSPNMTDLTSQMDLQFTDNGATDRITLQDDTLAGVANAFDNMTAGMTVTIANSTSNDGTYLITSVNAAGGYIDVTATDGTDPGLTTETSVAATTITGSGNDGTYTISAISTDGSEITLDTGTPLTADQTDTNSATLASATRGLNFTSASRMLIDDSADTLQIVDATNGAAITEAVQGLAAGMMFEISGTTNNDGFYVISSVDSATATITFDTTTPITGGDENYIPSAVTGGTGNLRVYGTTGTLAASANYYSGDEVLTDHRIEDGRSMSIDFTAIDPAFEKAIRAMGIIAQGTYGTAGGLDQNWDRLSDAIYLLDDALGETRTSDAPFGTEEFGNIEYIQQSMAFDRLVIEQTNARLVTLIGNNDEAVMEIEDIDQMEVITQLLTQQRSVEASYEAMARVQTLTLSDYL